MASVQSGGKTPTGHTDPAAGLDADRNVTFAAVGRAISDWEILEIRLAELYSIFVVKTGKSPIKKPRHTELITKFGEDGKITKDRLDNLEKAGAAYFCHYPDQGAEGQFDKIISEVRTLSTKRHRIAHGVVGGVAVRSTEYPASECFLPTIQMYAVVPPIYAARRLNRGMPYKYGSCEINKIALEFHVCAVKVLEFGRSLEQRP